MPKRNLFAEMTEGFDALAGARKCKKTLRTTEVTLKPVVELSADELRAIREKLNLSRPVLAGYAGWLRYAHYFAQTIGALSVLMASYPNVGL
jgi:DNA-binding transcriptional regulator YiaG